MARRPVLKQKGRGALLAGPGTSLFKLFKQAGHGARVNTALIFRCSALRDGERGVGEG